MYKIFKEYKMSKDIGTPPLEIESQTDVQQCKLWNRMDGTRKDVCSINVIYMSSISQLGWVLQYSWRYAKYIVTGQKTCTVALNKNHFKVWDTL